jgi:hypothetical protein
VRIFVRFAALSTLLAACGGAGLGTPIISNGPDVSASLSAVSLAEDCGEAKGAPGFGDQGACAEGTECPSFCQQSNLQIDLAADGGDAPVAFAIVAVRVTAENDDGLRDDLTSRSPRQWTSNGYVAWDEQIAPSAALKVSYSLSAPDWGALSSTARISNSGQTYRVEVDVRINGVLHTLSRGGVTREPEVAT